MDHTASLDTLHTTKFPCTNNNKVELATLCWNEVNLLLASLLLGEHNSNRRASFVNDSETMESPGMALQLGSLTIRAIPVMHLYTSTVDT